MASPNDSSDAGGGPEATGSGATTELEAARSGAEELFQSSELFEGLTPEEVREVVQVTDEITLEAGESLFEQGDESRALYVIAEGRLEVRSRTAVGEEVVLAELESGSVVGEMSIIGGGERSASVEAQTGAELYSLSRESFDSLREQDRPAAYKIVLKLARILGDRRRRADERIRKVFEDPDEHLDEFEEQVHAMLGSIRKA